MSWCNYWAFYDIHSRLSLLAPSDTFDLDRQCDVMERLSSTCLPPFFHTRTHSIFSQLSSSRSTSPFCPTLGTNNANRESTSVRCAICITEDAILLVYPSLGSFSITFFSTTENTSPCERQPVHEGCVFPPLPQFRLYQLSTQLVSGNYLA